MEAGGFNGGYLGLGDGDLNRIVGRCGRGGRREEGKAARGGQTELRGASGRELTGSKTASLV